MLNLYDDIAQRPANRTAIIENDREISYDEFFDRIDRFTRFIASGTPPGARVGIAGLSGAEFLAAVYACAKVGAVAVPVPSDDIERKEGILKAAQVSVVVDTRSDNEGPAERRSGIREAMIIFTSGTTSEGRKGVILGHEGISTTAQFMNRAMGIGDSVRELVFAPLDHAFAFGRCHAILIAHGTLVLTELSGFEALFGALQRHRVNALSAAPSVLASILRASEKRLAMSGAGLRWIQTGAMRFDPAFRDRLCKAFPTTRIFLHYGLSETMRVTFIELHAEAHKRHTEGRPADGVEVAILGPQGQRLPPGEEGVIALRGRNLCLGYTDGALWKRTYRDGWFVTSDRGIVDKEGYVIFAGRDDDAINAGGFLVHPDEIEARLQSLFPKQAFSVVGIPDPEGIKDKIIVVCVEGESTVTPKDVATAMEGSEAHMIPRLVASIVKLPRTRTEKVNRAELARVLSQRYR